MAAVEGLVDYTPFLFTYHFNQCVVHTVYYVDKTSSCPAMCRWVPSSLDQTTW